MSADRESSPELVRLARIESVLKAHAMHEPSCPVYLRNQAQAGTGMYLNVPDCKCWLTEPSDEPGGQS